MTKRTPPETLIELCDVIASGVLSYAAACRAVGISTRAFWKYIKASQGGDETYLIEYLGEQIQFAKAVNASRRMALHEMRGRMEQKSIMGYDEPVFYMGMPTYKPDPRCIGMMDDPDLLELLGLPRDGLLRDENGAVVQNVIHRESPIALQLRVAEMAFAEYRPTTNSNVAISGSVSAVVGVAMVAPRTSPPVIPPAPPLPQLEVLDDADDLQIPETNSDAPEEPPDDEPADDVQPIPPQARPTERVIAEPTPAQYQPTPPAAPLAPARTGRPLSALERDLLTRARGTPEERAAPIMAQPKLDRTRAS